MDDALVCILAQCEWRLFSGYALSNGVFMHRELVGLFVGDPRQVDHIDTNKLNNQLYNLRIVTRSQNNIARGLVKSNKSGFKGVTWNALSRKWQAFLKRDKKAYYLGVFSDPLQAAKAYDTKAEELFGCFAKTNRDLGLLD